MLSTFLERPVSWITILELWTFFSLTFLNHCQPCEIIMEGDPSVCNSSVATPSFDNSQCLHLAVKIEDSCQESVQCVQGSLGKGGECVMGKCQCRSQYYLDHSKGNQCLRKRVSLGGKCRVSSQCTANIGILSECKNGRCACKPGSLVTEDRKRCVKEKVPHGAGCEATEDCAGQNRQCALSGHCACQPGYTINGNETICLPIQYYLGGTCEESEQCKMGLPGERSDCIHNICSCTKDGVREPGEHTCYPKAVKVGDHCRRNVQCEVNLAAAYCAICANQPHCRCRDSAVASADGTKCLLKRNLDQNCLEDSQCQHIEGGVCISDSSNSAAPKSCTCKPEVYVRGKANPDKCYLKRSILNDPCDEDIQCTDVGWQASVTCVEHQCSCPPPKIFYNRNCVTPVALHNSCTSHDECQATGDKFTLCLGDPRQCKCMSFTIEDKNLCRIPNRNEDLSWKSY